MTGVLSQEDRDAARADGHAAHQSQLPAAAAVKLAIIFSPVLQDAITRRAGGAQAEPPGTTAA